LFEEKSSLHEKTPKKIKENKKKFDYKMNLKENQTIHTSNLSVILEYQLKAVLRSNKFGCSFEK
jgi:hypothetical protein